MTSPSASPGRRLHVMVLVALLALTFLLGCFPMGDFDVWWHLRTGQLILERGEVPRTDWFTYTNATRPWIDLYWLFQVGLALLFRAGGASALVLLKATSGTAMVALSLIARRRGGKTWPIVVAWLPAVVMLTGRLCERPELFSLLFLAGFLTVLGRAGERPRWLWFLPMIQILWVNCHGFFVLGPMVLAAYIAELLVDRHWPPATQVPRPPIKQLLLATGTTLLACLVNPYGSKAVTLPLEQFHKLGSTGIYRANIGELKTIGDFIATAGMSNPYLLAYFAVLALGIVSFVLQRRCARPSLFRLLLFAASAYLGWQATRNSALFALVAAFVIAWNLDEVSHSVRPAAKSSKRQRRPEVATKRNLDPVLLVVIVMLGLVTASGGLYAWAGEDRTVGFGERKNWYAHDACTFLARPDLPERIAAFNLSQAAVCIAHTAPAHKQFMDPRLELNSQQTFERYLDGIRKLWRGQPNWEAPLGIDYARPDETPALLIERGVLGRAADVLAKDPRWRRVYTDAVAVVFVTTEFAEAHGLAAAR
ncbi:MAG TPA: hypothetical protein VF550_03235 [Polyangia bacterium]